MSADTPAGRLLGAADLWQSRRRSEREAWALLVKAIVDADTAGMPRKHIAQISGVSRRGVYDILDKADRL